MSTKVFRAPSDKLGIHFRSRGELIQTAFITDAEATKLRDQLEDYFPSMPKPSYLNFTLPANAVAFPVPKFTPSDHVVEEGEPREWATWDEVPVDIRVEALGQWATNKHGYHDNWKKQEDSLALVWWAKDHHTVAEPTHAWVEPTGSGPFREHPTEVVWRRIAKLQLAMKAEKQKLADLERRTWNTWDEVPIGVRVDNLSNRGTHCSDPTKHDRYTKLNYRTLVEWAGSTTEILNKDQFDFTPDGPFREVIDG